MAFKPRSHTCHRNQIELYISAATLCTNHFLMFQNCRPIRKVHIMKWQLWQRIFFMFWDCFCSFVFSYNDWTVNLCIFLLLQPYRCVRPVSQDPQTFSSSHSTVDTWPEMHSGLDGKLSCGPAINNEMKNIKPNYILVSTQKQRNVIRFQPIHLLFTILQKVSPAVKILRIVTGKFPKPLKVCRHLSLLLLFSFCCVRCRWDACVSSISTALHWLLNIWFRKFCNPRLIKLCHWNQCVWLNTLQCTWVISKSTYVAVAAAKIVIYYGFSYLAIGQFVFVFFLTYFVDKCFRIWITQ